MFLIHSIRIWCRHLLSPIVSVAGLFLAACGPSVAPQAADQRLERVVSLAPNLTEIVCAIGAADCLAGRTSVCDYPPEIIRQTPVVGAFGNPTMEALLAVKPTLVIDTDLEDESIVATMTGLGIKRLRVPCARLSEIPQAITTLGGCLHRESEARALATNIMQHVAELKAAMAERPGAACPSVFLEIWNDPLMTVGKNSFVSELVALSGGRNIGDAVTNREYYAVSSEWVMAQDPDIVICLYMTSPAEGGDPRAGALKLVAGRPGGEVTKAVRLRRVYGGLDNNVILRPGPRILEGIEALRRCIVDRGIESELKGSSVQCSVFRTMRIAVVRNRM